MDTYIVVPCLNEAAHLVQTCASLGFAGTGDAQAHLVLVDNGSEDETLEVMRSIRNACGPDTVHIVHEPHRGYVPARSAGPRYIAASGVAASSSPLILQADADTVYLPGYVQQMQQEASRHGRGHVFEAAAVTAAEFRQKYLAFDDLCRTIDEELSEWFVSEEDEVVVDDKVSGFFLADYFEWGGHFVQRTRSGAELLAETTRFFISGKQGFGARKIKVRALALPSRRKLEIQGLAYFASAGFPRGAAWNAQWSERACGAAASFMENPHASPCTPAAIGCRRRHELALFALLPVLVDARVTCRPELLALCEGLRASDHASALERVLELADDEGGVLQRFADSPHAAH